MIKQADIAESIATWLKQISDDNSNNWAISKHVAKWVNNNREAINPTPTPDNDDGSVVDRDRIIKQLSTDFKNATSAEQRLKISAEISKLEDMYKKGDNDQEIEIITINYTEAVLQDSYKDQFLKE